MKKDKMKVKKIMPVFGDYIDVYNMINEQIIKVIDDINLKSLNLSKLLKLQNKLIKLENDRDLVMKLIKEQNYDVELLKKLKIIG